MYAKVVRVPHSGWDLTFLFHELQDAAGEASALYHASSDDLAKFGLMWVVVRYEVLFERPVLPGEDLFIQTWAMPFRHKMSQRNYRITDQEGALVLTAAGIWTIVDRESRKMVDPADYPLQIPGEVTDYAIGRPANPEKVNTVHQMEYPVQPSDLDTNVHMNNARYFKLAESCIEKPIPGERYRLVRAAYLNEAKLGDSIKLSWGTEGNVSYFSGRVNGLACFEISIRYESDSKGNRVDF